jgi:GNAT superfamily N-acetyltransferase
LTLLPATVRPAEPADYPDLSHLIRGTLRSSNAADYNRQVILNLQRAYSAAALARLAKRRRIWVAVDEDDNGRIVGTVSLEDDTVQGLFVAVDRQGEGIGRRLMGYAEAAARAKGRNLVRLSSSLTALQFYLHLGYQEIEAAGDEFYGPVVRMMKRLDR